MTSRTGTEHGLRDFLFPALRQTYDDLLDAATKPERADLLLLGELNYAGPLVAEVTGNSVGQLRAGAALVFLRLRSAGAARLPAAGARRRSRAGASGELSSGGAFCKPQVARAYLRTAPRAGTAQGRESAFRRQALALPCAGPVFTGAGHRAEGLAAAHDDYRLLLLRRGRGQPGAAS